jgi:exopolysaccharide biosynthesis polyprenyl glycosylphosphotransferase
MYQEYRPYKLLLMALDVTATVLILRLMVELRPYLPGKLVSAEDALLHPLVYLLVALLWHMMFALAGVYQLGKIARFDKQLPRFTSAYSLVTLIFAGLLFFSYREVSRMLIVYFCSIDYLVLVLMRLSLDRILRRRHAGFLGRSAIIVGTNENSVRLAEILIRDHGAIIKLAGFVDNEVDPERKLPRPMLGSIGQIESLIQDHGIDIVMIALSGHQASQARSIVFNLESLPVQVYLVPDLLNFSLVNVDVDVFGEIVAIGIREPVIRGHRRLFKRIMDVTVSTSLLLLLGPLMLLIWVAIRFDSPGRAIFVAKRVGENGRLFNMYKFRTMVVGAEQKQSQVQVKDDQDRTIYKIKDDPRVTRLGRILRRTSLDELPQLVNVLKGEMSLVGPRPEQPFITKSYDHYQWRRLSVPPGITGWWQVNGRSDVAMHLNSQYDIYYVRNFSIFLDVWILLKTFGVVIRGKGAY